MNATPTTPHSRSDSSDTASTPHVDSSLASAYGFDEPAAAQSFLLSSHDCGAALAALSTSPDHTLVAVGGREVMKIIQIDENGQLSEKVNMRSRSSNLNFGVVDLKWHPMQIMSHLLASAPTNGAMILWNLNKRNAGSKTIERKFTEHTRTVNKVTWQPYEPDILLSGSQDGTVKVWDIRQANSVATYQCHGEVRDIQFSPHYRHFFATGIESGNVIIWDIRKQDVPQKTISAHNGLVLSLEWHPTNKSLLATASRDRLIKVWDMNNTNRPFTTVQTIASVARIAWRPGFNNHIASSATLFDANLNIWDLQNPYVPYLALKNHKDIITAIQFFNNSPDHVLTCSKDHTLQLAHLSTGYNPKRDMSTAGLSWNARNELAMVNAVVDRRDPIFEYDSSQNVLPTPTSSSSLASAVSDLDSPTSPISATAAAAAAASAVASAGTSQASAVAAQVQSLFQAQQRMKKAASNDAVLGINQCLYNKAEGSVLIVGEDEQHTSASAALRQQLFGDGLATFDMNPETIAHFARNYMLFDGSIEEKCEKNAAVAAQVGKFQIQKVWDLIKLLYVSFKVKDEETENLHLLQEVHGAFSDEEDESELGDAAPSIAAVSSLAGAVVNDTTAAALTDRDNSSDSDASLSEDRHHHFQRSPNPAAMYYHHPVSPGIDGVSAGGSESFDATEHEDNESEEEQDEDEDEEDDRDILAEEDDLAGFLEREDDEQYGNDFDDDDEDDSNGSDLGGMNGLDDNLFCDEHEDDEPGMLMSMDLNSPFVEPFDSDHSDIKNGINGHNRAEDGIDGMGTEDDEGVSASASAAHGAADASTSTTKTVRRPPAPVIKQTRAAQTMSYQRAESSLLGPELDGIIYEVLNFYAELGDVQTCVAIVATIGDKQLDQLDLTTVIRWYFEYIDLLRMLKLFVEAAQIIKRSPYALVNSMNQQYTTMRTSCGLCGSLLESRNSSICSNEKCARYRKSTVRCLLCHLPVMGEMVWCQACGKGGHLDCLTSFYGKHKFCPSCKNVMPTVINL